MKHFCFNPECQCFDYPDDKDHIVIPIGSNGDYKNVERIRYINWSEKEGYKNLYFCSVCIGALELIKMTI